MEERVIVVDENDNQIGVKERCSLTPNDIARASSIWLTDPEGNVLMAKRTLIKKINPGLWGPAASGGVSDVEDYDTNIINEVREEIGLELDIQKLKKGPKKLQHGGYNRFFNQWYLYTMEHKAEDEFSLQEDEVEIVKWWNPDELKKESIDDPEKFVRGDRLVWLEYFLK